MFQLQKIAAHIQLLENRMLKLVSHKAAVEGAFDSDPSKVTFKERERLVEIERQITRMQHSINGYQAKMDRFNELNSRT